ncbi:MAG: hypothetical protein AB8E15_04530 [Bdellovibrionales bacterium]
MTDADHIRRCHKCGTTIEGEGRIERCSHCGNTLAPFFYFDEGKNVTYSEALLRPPSLPDEYIPLVGISTVWRT